MNPTYYGVEDNEPDTLNKFLSDLIENTFQELAFHGCVGLSFL